VIDYYFRTLLLEDRCWIDNTLERSSSIDDMDSTVQSVNLVVDVRIPFPHSIPTNLIAESVTFNLP
jgi:hypothetical protein